MSEAGSSGPADSDGSPAGRPDGLRLGPDLIVPLDELTWRFSTSGGAGGQHVNTSNTRAEVVFDVAGSPSLPVWAKNRLVAALGSVVTVAASDRRSQLRNRELALERLGARLRDALVVRAPRRPTRPSKSSQRRRVDTKRRHGALKRQRREGGNDPD